MNDAILLQNQLTELSKDGLSQTNPANLDNCKISELVNYGVKLYNRLIDCDNPTTKLEIATKLLDCATQQYDCLKQARNNHQKNTASDIATLAQIDIGILEFSIEEAPEAFRHPSLISSVRKLKAKIRNLERKEERANSHIVPPVDRDLIHSQFKKSAFFKYLKTKNSDNLSKFQLALSVIETKWRKRLAFKYLSLYIDSISKIPPLFREELEKLLKLSTIRTVILKVFSNAPDNLPLNRKIKISYIF